MAVETADDLAAMFHPDDFGVPMTALSLGGSTPFNGIRTTGHAFEQPGVVAQVSMMVPRIIATKASLPDIAQGDEIQFADGQRVQIVDVQYKGELIIIHYHEHW